MATKLSAADVGEQLAQLGGWTQNGETIHKTFVLPSFPAAIAFVTHIGFLAEAANHHPDIDIRFTKVVLKLTTYAAGGSDFALAAQADALA